jgi:peptidoglycan/LPS O-acetylase OafA/YrhL
LHLWLDMNQSSAAGHPTHRSLRPNHRYEELDSLRGLAAITVLIAHYSNLFLVQSGPYVRAGEFVQSVRRTPLFALFAGHEAVMLFFVLSGFVLSLQFLRGKPVDYGSFAIKRIFRIYVPYLIALGVAVTCCKFLYSGHIDELSDWFNTPWSEGITGRALLDHIIFLGSYKTDRFDPVLWSLVHELRISLVFPFLIALFLKRTWKGNLLLAVALSLFGTTTTLGLVKFGIHWNFFLTMHFVAMFILGFLLAQNVSAIYAWFRNLNFLFRAGIALIGFCLYAFSHGLPGRLKYFEDLPVAAGAALIVITGICSLKTSAFLRRGIVKFFGDISYSLYLYHAVVLISLTHALYGRVHVSVILVLAAAVTILVSRLSYKYIELPAIRWGKVCSGYVQREQPGLGGQLEYMP